MSFSPGKPTITSAPIQQSGINSFILLTLSIYNSDKYPMSHRMDEIKPAHYVTREECKEMIDDAIRKHNRNAGIISMFVGFFVLGLFSEGLLRLIGVIPPVVPWIHPHL